MPALGSINRHVVEDSARTAFAAVASFLIARLLRMPEAYWATISTIIVMQCKNWHIRMITVGQLATLAHWVEEIDDQPELATGT